jgi:hypothetical protein
MSRRNGRPPLDPNDPSVRVCVAVPSKRYAAMARTAAIGRVSVPELFRRALDRQQKYIKQTLN